MRPDNATDQASLKEDYALYKRMIEEVQDYAIILLDTDGIIRNWNKGAQKIKHYKEEEILGKHFSIFYLQEDLDNGLPQRLIDQASSTGSAAQEGWRKRKDGTHFWGTITITALHDDAGNVIGFSKVTRDLTDRKLMEDSLRMSEERYHQMIAEVQDYAIILLSAEGVIENWNVGAEKIKGYKSSEIVGKKFEVFYTPEDQQSGLPYKLLGRARAEGRATHEGWRIRKDGTKFWGSITITALHGRDDRIIGFSKVTRDLTQKKIAEDKVAAYMAELEIQNSELEQFAYVASHDLQEPLRKIQTFTDVIRENFEDRELVLTYFDKLAASARRMSELIRSLLNYSHITKSFDARLAVIDLNKVAAQVLHDLELLIDDKKATINCGHLPVVQGNQMQLEQLFTNLINNALKFSHRPPVITIDVNEVSSPDRGAPSHAIAASYYCIAFRDNGIGFENDYRDKIFSLFQRLHGRNDFPGTGIGLTLCKKIAEGHDGFITASGVPGEGATFCVYLPVSRQ